MTTHDISGLDKLQLLKELWTRSPPARFFTANGIPGPAWNQQEALKALEDRIDYFNGRLIGCDLRGDTAEESKRYKEDVGAGQFAAAIAAVRAAKK